jgi:hypothetical protein
MHPSISSSRIQEHLKVKVSSNITSKSQSIISHQNEIPGPRPSFDQETFVRFRKEKTDFETLAGAKRKRDRAALLEQNLTKQQIIERREELAARRARREEGADASGSDDPPTSVPEEEDGAPQDQQNAGPAGNIRLSNVAVIRMRPDYTYNVQWPETMQVRK